MIEECVYVREVKRREVRNEGVREDGGEKNI